MHPRKTYILSIYTNCWLRSDLISSFVWKFLKRRCRRKKRTKVAQYNTFTCQSARLSHRISRETQSAHFTNGSLTRSRKWITTWLSISLLKITSLIILISHLKSSIARLCRNRPRGRLGTRYMIFSGSSTEFKESLVKQISVIAVILEMKSLKNA